MLVVWRTKTNAGFVASAALGIFCLMAVACYDGRDKESSCPTVLPPRVMVSPVANPSLGVQGNRVFVAGVRTRPGSVLSSLSESEATRTLSVPQPAHGLASIDSGSVNVIGLARRSAPALPWTSFLEHHPDPDTGPRSSTERSLVADGHEIRWHRNAGTRALLADDGVTSHLVVPMQHPERGIVYIRRRPAGTLLTQISKKHPVSYVDLALGPTDRDLYLAFVGPVPAKMRWNANSVFFQRSPDGGETWTTPVLVSFSGLAEAHSAKIAVPGTGEIHVLWLKNLSGGWRPEVVWHTVSADTGQTWTPPMSLPGVTNPRQLKVVAGGAGAVYAVLSGRRLSGGRNRLLFMRWTGSTWLVPCELDPGHGVAECDIRPDKKGRLHLFWNRDGPGGQGSLYTILSPSEWSA